MAFPVPTIALPTDQWTAGGSAVNVRDGATLYGGVVTTSNSTVCVPDVPNGMIAIVNRLWMYGIGVGSLVIDAWGNSVPVLAQTANVVLSYLPTAYGTQNNIAYVQSNSVDFTAPASDYVFDLDLASDPEPLKSTGIPHQVERRMLDGYESMSVYKDPHVLKLKDGKGWLMLLARYHSPDGPGVVFGPGRGAVEPTETNSVAAIVGYWCDEPTFTSDVKGPYFLVGRFHTFTEARVDFTAPLWLGVPAACELQVDNVDWLYIYYTGQSTDVDPEGWVASTLSSFRAGTHVTRIDTRFLPWGNSFGLAFDNRFTSASTDEERWNSARYDELVWGEYLGKVNIWVGNGKRWKSGGNPAAEGNDLIWDVYDSLKDVDAVPMVFDDGVALYFAANDNGAAPAGGTHAWGLWRSVLGPAVRSRTYGMDFVVRPVDDANLGGNEDLIARSNPADQAGDWYDDGTKMRLDPDPVRLPSGEWVVFTGASAEGGSPLFAHERYEADQNTAESQFKFSF